jgi:23S rRNA pseudouridine1911/1915/1917 synthase
VVAPAETTKDQETLADILQKDFGINLERGGIAHRLDKDTSGIMLIAKTSIALENLQHQFKERMVKKEYLALVHGLMDKGGVVSGSISRNPKNREKFIVFDDGKPAETAYEPVTSYQLPATKYESIFGEFNKIQKRKLERNDYGKFTLVRCFPLTGRTHQIRVHLKHIGFSIVGDEKYGGRKTARLDGRWCKRQFLHAAKIQFYHPQDGRKMEFESELPEDLKEALGNLEQVK